MITHNKILHGDCTHIMLSLPAKTVDLVVTDPPYLVNNRDRSGRSITNDDAPDNVLAAFPELFRLGQHLCCRRHPLPVLFLHRRLTVFVLIVVS